MEESRQYLYEYKNGKRIRNIGFFKIEKKMDQCVIRIYGQNLDEVQGIQFCREDGGEYLGGWGPEVEEVPEMVAKPEDEEARIMEAEVEEYLPRRNAVFEKITRQDLSRLPRKEWRLANNSFLLHGYYNYHHLLYIEENGNVFIGVPGIYHEKERAAAEAFGFTAFRRMTDVSIDLDENEKNTYEDFGYWCRQIPK